MLSEVFCSYCLRPRSESGRLVASPIAAICRDCTDNAQRLFDTIPPGEADLDGAATPWASLSDSELLDRLPEIAAAGKQVEAHLGAWVAATRERGISWARIGDTLGMTRQSAWERFSSAHSAGG